MCGFVGFLRRDDHAGSDDGEAVLRSMADRIASRGPDDAGYWHDAQHHVGLGHRRLSIIDLSDAGHQPMVSASDRYVIAFNGEIYNHLALRDALDRARSAPNWRGHSDTETFLAGFDHWGIEKTLDRAVGMYAFAAWDRQNRTLTLARDRLGEKPLYYGWQDGTFLFGSELKALRAHSAFRAEIDRDSICLLLRHNYVPAPYSIYQGIAKLQAGCFLTVSSSQPEPEITAYWSIEDTAIQGAACPFSGSADQAVDELESLATSAIQQQMISDVPLGAFLSGGIDSSTVVALAQSQSSQPVKTFSIGFHEYGFNEAVYAKSVAQHLGTEHTELYVTNNDALEIIPALPNIYCEPFSDSSQIPTYLVSKMAQQHVTVSLSGDGGDELFCGYGRYQRSARLWGRLERVPGFVRDLAAMSMRALSPTSWDRLAGLMPVASRVAHFGDRIHKASEVVVSRNFDDLYLNFQLSSHRNPEKLVLGGREAATVMAGNQPELPGLDKMQRMMTLDLMTYLPDDILTKVDRAAMAVSLETRVPFLDHRIVEFAMSLPQEIKVRDEQLKWPLRQLLCRHVPRELVERPKMGFGVPLDSWLRGPLRDWAEMLLGEERLSNEGFFDPVPIRRMWDEHITGKRRWHNQLWSVLMFQSWLAEQKTT